MVHLAEVENVLDQTVRPCLALHKGTIEVRDWHKGVLSVVLLGQCSACPSAELSTRQWIQEALSARIPEIREVVLLQAVNEDLLDQARSLLRRHEEQ